MSSGRGMAASGSCAGAEWLWQDHRSVDAEGGSRPPGHNAASGQDRSGSHPTCQTRSSQKGALFDPDACIETRVLTVEAVIRRVSAGALENGVSGRRGRAMGPSPLTRPPTAISYGE